MIRMRKTLCLFAVGVALALGALKTYGADNKNDVDSIYDAFANPASKATPGVYWFFLDANLSKAGMNADLEAMKRAGLGRAIAMEADLGGPKGNVNYMTPEWLDCWKNACKRAEELGIELTTSVGPGWCGAGGPWIDPEHSMQHLRASTTRVQGGKKVDVSLPVPEPRDPYFGRGSLGPCENDWKNFYRDVAVVAYPTPKSDAKLPDWEEKALFFRPPYSSLPGVKPYLVPATDSPSVVEALRDAVVPFDSILDLSDKMNSEGRLLWDAPEGEWTVLRLGRRLTGQTTRPAPAAALGLESDKFEKSGIERHFEAFDSKLLDIGKFTTLHHDSWEMSSQNWSEHFRELFIAKRGYDPIRWAPAIFGTPVESVELTERFLWDLRRVGQELVYENNVLRMKELAAEKGLNFSSEVYDLNPAGDLYLFRAADVPMCEFWSRGYGFDSSFSVFEAVSSAHTNNKPIVASESFTSAGDKWRQHPGIAKRQGDWALCAGVNRIYFHRMCSQPNDDAPGLSLGPHGMHFDRTQTWFPLVDEYCRFLARVQSVLQGGTPSVDVLFLDQDTAPSVYEAPSSMFLPGEFKDKNRYNFDGVCPQNLIDDARAENGKIVFPGGAAYSLLVLPRSNEMSVELAAKLKELADAGVPMIGFKPTRAPTLVNYPNVDGELKKIVDELWNGPNAPANVPYPTPLTTETRAPLTAAKWLWDDNDWKNAQPNVQRVFSTNFALSQDEFDAIQAENAKALLIATADNLYEAYLNGALVLQGNNFHSPDVADVQKYLKVGDNDLRIVAVNEGETPNPVGMIAALQIGAKRIVTDSSWRVSKSLEDSDSRPALELGAYNMSPWNVNLTVPFDRDSTYPNGELIRARLAELGVKPDFASKTNNVRWIHKIFGDVDVYYIGSRVEDPFVDVCEFRVCGKAAQLWNPMTAERYALDNLKESDGVSSAEIPFESSQSWFVVFTPNVAETNALPDASALFARKATPYLSLARDWNVEFDQNAAANRNFERGKPMKTHFDSLIDWSKSGDEYLKHYSGIAVYERSFDMPPDFESVAEKNDFLLLFENVQVMAKVEINGETVGTVWTKPWRLAVPKKTLKAKGNRIKITVANLWCNRLIGDAALPAEERFTRSSNPMWSAGDEQLLPSGLIGALTLATCPK